MPTVPALQLSHGPKVFAVLAFVEGRTRILVLDTRSLIEIESFIANGLSEWVGPDNNPTLRTTPSTDPAFLERLATYFKRQFGMTSTWSEVSTEDLL